MRLSTIQTGLLGEADKLCPIADMHQFINTADVGLYRMFTQVQPVCDFTIFQPLAEDDFRRWRK